jgi:fumarylacetoacetate (FAA) hydrolase family protein
MSGWDKARAEALKILGDGAEVPDLPDTVVKGQDALDEAAKVFKTAREDCEAKLLETDNANAACMNAAQQFRARIEKNVFNLDAKKDAKKIQQAQKLLLARLDDGLKALQRNDKMLDELDKHMIQLGKYKQSPSSI